MSKLIRKNLINIMKNQIQIASELKDSKLVSTLAHETRKNNAGRILFLSLCVVVALAVGAVFTSCKDNNGDDTIVECEVSVFDGSFTAIVENGNDYNSIISKVKAFVHLDVYVSGSGIVMADEVASGDYSNGGFTITFVSSPDADFLYNVEEAFFVQELKEEGINFKFSDKNVNPF